MSEDTGTCRLLEPRGVRNGVPGWYLCQASGKQIEPARNCTPEVCGRFETWEEFEGRQEAMGNAEATAEADGGRHRESEFAPTRETAAETAGTADATSRVQALASSATDGEDSNSGQAGLPGPPHDRSVALMHERNDLSLPEVREMAERGTIQWTEAASETVVDAPDDVTLLEWATRLVADGQSINAVAGRIGCAASTLTWHLDKALRGNGGARRNGVGAGKRDWDGDAAEAVGDKLPEGCEGMTLREVAQLLHRRGLGWIAIPKALGLSCGASAVEKACRGTVTAKASAETQRTQGTDAEKGEARETATAGEATADGGNGSRDAEIAPTVALTRERSAAAADVMPQGITYPAPGLPISRWALAAEYIKASGQEREFGYFVLTGEVG